MAKEKKICKACGCELTDDITYKEHSKNFGFVEFPLCIECVSFRNEVDAIVKTYRTQCKKDFERNRLQEEIKMKEEWDKINEAKEKLSRFTLNDVSDERIIAELRNRGYYKVITQRFKL